MSKLILLIFVFEQTAYQSKFTEMFRAKCASEATQQVVYIVDYMSLK